MENFHSLWKNFFPNSILRFSRKFKCSWVHQQFHLSMRWYLKIKSRHEESSCDGSGETSCLRTCQPWRIWNNGTNLTGNIRIRKLYFLNAVKWLKFYFKINVNKNFYLSISKMNCTRERKVEDFFLNNAK